MAFKDDPNAEYQQLSNLTPATASSSSSLQGLGGFLNKFRSQSRLGMLDIDIVGQRKGVQPAPEFPSIPEAPPAYTLEFPSTPEAQAKKDAEAGPGTFKPAPGTFSVQPGTFTTQPGTFSVQPGTFTPQVGGFMPSGSTQQIAAQLTQQRLDEARQRGMI